MDRHKPGMAGNRRTTMSIQSTGPQDLKRFLALKAPDREHFLFEKWFFEAIAARRPDWMPAMRALAAAYTQLGYYHDGLRLDRLICAALPEEPGARYDLACSFALTGDADSAIAALQEACRLGYTDRVHTARDPDLASLHKDLRFIELLRAMTRPKR